MELQIIPGRGCGATARREGFSSNPESAPRTPPSHDMFLLSEAARTDHSLGTKLSLSLLVLDALTSLFSSSRHRARQAESHRVV